jgi:predicted nucleic acid-binding protein
MNVVDSSAWLSYFAADANTDKFAGPIEDLQRLLVPSITLAEVFKHVYRHRDEESALAVVAHMQQGRVVPLDSELAVNAASYGITHKLPLADSIIFATAQRYDATLWTQDQDFDGLPGVRFYARQA